MKLLVRNLARTTTEHELRVLFSTHGSVGQCSLVLDEKTGLSKGFAFIDMADDAEARKAISELNLSTLANSKIRVKQAKD